MAKNELGEKIYGYCPICNYELTIENSTFAPMGGDSNEIIAKRLLEYHYNANPECKIKK